MSSEQTETSPKIKGIKVSYQRSKFRVLYEVNFTNKCSCTQSRFQCYHADKAMDKVEEEDERPAVIWNKLKQKIQEKHSHRNISKSSEI